MFTVPVTPESAFCFVEHVSGVYNVDEVTVLILQLTTYKANAYYNIVCKMITCSSGTVQDVPMPCLQRWPATYVPQMHDIEQHGQARDGQALASRGLVFHRLSCILLESNRFMISRLTSCACADRPEDFQGLPDPR